MSDEYVIRVFLIINIVPKTIVKPSIRLVLYIVNLPCCKILFSTDLAPAITVICCVVFKKSGPNNVTAPEIVVVASLDPLPVTIKYYYQMHNYQFQTIVLDLFV